MLQFRIAYWEMDSPTTDDSLLIDIYGTFYIIYMLYFCLP